MMEHSLLGSNSPKKKQFKKYAHSFFLGRKILILRYLCLLYGLPAVMLDLPKSTLLFDNTKPPSALNKTCIDY